MYMIIGNINFDARAHTSSYSTVMVGLLCMPPKFKSKMKRFNRTVKQNCNWRVLEEALGIILDPLIAVVKDRIMIDSTNLQLLMCY